jgi:hypothetical protein
MEGDFSSQAVSKNQILYTPNPPPAWMIIHMKVNTNNYKPNAESLTVLGLPAHYNSTQSLLNA